MDKAFDAGAAAVAARFDLTGRRALVTGGSLSMGRAIALGLAQAGADVVIHHWPQADAAFGQPGAAQSASEAIEALGRRAAVSVADFSRPGAGRQAVADAVGALGGVDILVVCASVQARTSFLETTAEDIAWQVATNFASTVELLQAALPAMIERGWGRVLSIGSLTQVKPSAGLAIYSALKAGQHNLILNLARQHARDGVTLNTLAPGLIATERNRWRREDAESWAALQAGASATGRAGLPEDMVGAALLLSSDAGAFITGAELMAGGGGHL